MGDAESDHRRRTAQVREFLEHEVGMSREQVERCRNEYKRLDDLNVDEMRATVASLKEFGFSKAGAAKAIAGNPLLLGLSAKEVVERLETFLSFGVKAEHVVQYVSGNSTGLRYKPEFLRKHLKDLRDTFGVKFSRGCTLWLVGYSAETLQEKLNLLRSLGLNDQQLRRICEKVPEVLKFSREQIERVFDVLRTDLEILPEDLPHMVVKNPHLLMRGQDTLRRKFSLLLEYGLTADEARTVIVTNPTTLNLSDGNLREKLDFLLLHFPLVVISRCPRALTSSLRSRLRPRVLFLSANGVSLSLGTIATLPDLRFCAAAKCSLEELRLFQGRIPALAPV